MGEWIHRLLFDQELMKIDKQYRKKMMQSENEEEEKGYRLLHKYIRIYQIWRRNLILGIIGGVLLLLLLFAVGKGVSAAISGFRSGRPTQSGEKKSKKTETETETESETETETETEAIQMLPSEVDLTLTFTGDCILGTDESFFYDTGFTAYYDNYGPDYFMKNVRPIFEKDDLTIVNMEGTLTNETIREPKEFAFRADPEYVKILSNSSVEAANLANNHSHDYGEQSYLDTKRILEENKIRTFGYDDVALLEVKGVKIGIYGIYELDDHLERIPQLKNNIQKLKDMKADIIIGIFHWSNELEITPDENAMTIGHLAIDEGTDLIVGHHPHVIQGIEEYKGKNIVYSLGNFCFGGNVHPYNLDTFIYQQTFTISKDRKIKKTENNIIPCWISSDTYQNNYQPTPMDEEHAKQSRKKIAKLSSLIGTDGSTYFNPQYDYYGVGSYAYDDIYYDDGTEDAADDNTGTVTGADTATDTATWNNDTGYDQNTGYNQNTGY